MHDGLALARALHVSGVVVWIGGVAMVTMVVLPAVKQIADPEKRVEMFEAIEGRFTWIARFETTLVGLTGFYMLWRMGLTPLLTDINRWYLTAMILIWTVFSIVLFVAEPLFLHRWFHENGKKDPERTFYVLTVMHWVLFLLSIFTVFGVVSGAHGWLWFYGT